MAQSKEERLFTLTCALLAAGSAGLTKEQILHSVQGYKDAGAGSAVDKLFERDKASLREAGIALEVSGQDDFADTPEDPKYRIPRGSFSWPKGFELNAAKLQLLELAARAWNQQSLSVAARQGLTRLKALGLVQLESQFEIFAPRLLAQHFAFAPLSNAIANLTVVRFDYKKPDGQISTRIVQPWKLRQIEGQWVLLAKEPAESFAKNFLLRRIYSRIELSDETFSNPNPEEIAKAEKALDEFVSQQIAKIEIQPNSEASSYFGTFSDDFEIVEINYMDEGLFAEDLRELGSTVKVIFPESLARAVKIGFEEVLTQHA